MTDPMDKEPDPTVNEYQPRPVTVFRVHTDGRTEVLYGT